MKHGSGYPAVFAALLLISLLADQLTAVKSEEFTIDGLGCDSCGRDCSAVCGSRAFRSCCFNYIKKRSDNSSPASASSNFYDLGQANSAELGGKGVGNAEILEVASSLPSRNVLVLADGPRRFYGRPGAARKFSPSSSLI